jgi:glycogen debranching enzyme
MRSQPQIGQAEHTDGNRRVTRHGRSSITSSIAHAVVIKHDELFFLCEPNGEIPMDVSHGLGLYYHDCRYLNGYQLRVGGMRPDRLAINAAPGFWMTLALANPDVTLPDGSLVEKERISIIWDRVLDASTCALYETMTLTNFSADHVDLPITIELRSGFESILVVRGVQPEHRGTVRPPHWIDAATLELAYDGSDGVKRVLRASFDPAPHHASETAAAFRVSMDSRQTATLSILLSIHETRPGTSSRSNAAKPDVSEIRRTLRESSDEWIQNATHIDSNSSRLNTVLDRSLRDLHLLRTTLGTRKYFAGGVPWYVDLFGRDSLISAIEALAFLPDTAEDTLHLLASYQGTHDDAWPDEAPGKIMHELRVGELANTNEIPQTPYYGTVDATPLFLILLGRHAAWTGRIDLFNDLTPNVEAALGWIDRTIAAGGTGFLAYSTTSTHGLANQGWKDSGDSIVNEDGSLAKPPIALVEVQGYVYLAKRSIAELYRRAGQAERAHQLIAEAEALREHFEQHFWIDRLGTYALALQDNNKPAAVVSSNPGQVLWTGIAADDRAAATAQRLMQEDMFSGWGIRTLSSRAVRYNPIGYHTGTIWPHDNAMIVSGFRKYRCLQALRRTITGVLRAAAHFDHDRLPEVFAGVSGGDFTVPVHYPVACHPQAFAAAAVPFMLESALGLVPDAFNRTLRISSPILPASITTLSIDRLRVGDARARIEFTRSPRGEITVRDVAVNGNLEVIVD